MHCPRCQQRRFPGTSSVHARVPQIKKVQSAAKIRHGLSFTYTLKPGTAKLMKPTVERARTLRQTCFAAVTQANKKAVQLTHPADDTVTTDKEQAGLSQVLLCISNTFSAAVCMPCLMLLLGLQLADRSSSRLQIRICCWSCTCNHCIPIKFWALTVHTCMIGIELSAHRHLDCQG